MITENYSIAFWGYFPLSIKQVDQRVRTVIQVKIDQCLRVVIQVKMISLDT